MARTALTGTRIRERRTMLGLKQAELARQAGISASYLNLIEHNRRRIGGALLKRIAAALEVELAQLTQGAETATLDQLGEAAAALPGTAAEVERIDEFVGRFPGWAGLIAAQQRRAARLEQRVEALTDRLAHDPYLPAALHELLSKAAAIRSTAAILVETDDLDETWTRRFQRNLFEDSTKLADGASALAGYLDGGGQAELGLVSPQEELETFLNATGFHIAALEGPSPADPDALVDAAPALRSAPARALARAHLARYRVEAQAMPLDTFAEAAAAHGHDPARLAALFSVSLPAVFRRLAALPAGRAGQGVAFAACDGAGALVLRKAGDLFPTPRFGAACPRWPLYRALAQPGTPARAVLAHASRPDEAMLAFALAETRHPQGLAGPAIREAQMIVLPPALAPPPQDAGPPETVGTTCRVCPLPDCPARREPSILADGFDSPAPVAQ